jgi:hypothetical protein
MLPPRLLTLVGGVTCSLLLASTDALSQFVPAANRAASVKLLPVSTRDDDPRAERHREERLRDERLRDERLREERLREERIHEERLREESLRS